MSQPLDTLSNAPSQLHSEQSKISAAAPLSFPQQKVLSMRKTSVDSASSMASSSTMTSQRAHGLVAEKAQADSGSIQSAASFIAAAGSAEAAVVKLMQEKLQTTSHNAQLWRLVEKQRAMILGLNKDLERLLKENDVYRQKIKDQINRGDMQFATAEAEADSTASRRSNSPPREENIKHPVAGSALAQNVSPGPRLGNVSDHTSPLISLRSDTPQEDISASLAGFPSTPKSINAVHSERRNKNGLQLNERQNSSANSSGLGETYKSESGNIMMKMNSPSFSSPKQGVRKAPPAPLQLSPIVPVIGPVEGSESEYEDDPVIAREEQMLRGRRKTREEDDRERELAALSESEARSRSKKSKQRKDTKPHGSDSAPEPMGAAIVSQLAVSNLKASSSGPSLLSPGLPMSPRPGDRPMNSPMPRAPHRPLDAPMSPNSGIIGLPLSPRLNKQPLQSPTNRELPLPHLNVPQSDRTGDNVIVQDQSLPSAPSSYMYNHGLPRTTSQREIYRGLVSDDFPDLLLPPQALHSVVLKISSSRPSRQIHGTSKPGDESHLLIIAVYSRTDMHQLWRVEKTFTALAAFDTQIKIGSSFREGFPDKSLLIGHSPAKIDARRFALDTYFESLLKHPFKEKSLLTICEFISTGAIGPEEFRESHQTLPLDHVSTSTNGKFLLQRAGYLTKRGKNFGGWKSRYFVLDDSSLRYYEAPGGAHLGSIKLQNAQIGKQAQQAHGSHPEDADKEFRHAFLILEPKKKDSSSLVRHVLCAENDAERDAWVDALLQRVDDYGDHEERIYVAPAHTDSNSLQSRSHIPKTFPEQQNPLVTINYEETVAGEAPVIGSVPMNQEVQTGAKDEISSIHPVISGPTNPTMIQNAGDWGMRVPMTPSFKDLAKDKKRSMFSAFRGRSSTELAPEKSLNSPLFGSETHMQPLFGLPLGEAVNCVPPSTRSNGLPVVVFRCIEYLTTTKAVLEEGIFRLSGSNTVIKAIKDRFNTESDIDLVGEGSNYDVHAVASLLKLYLRELPASILTRELHLEFLHCLELPHREKIVTLNSLVQRLPTCNGALLFALTAFLRSIVENAELNKMNLRNVGIVFAPTLNVPGPLISSFVEDMPAIFGPSLHEGQPIPASTLTVPAQQSTELRSPRKQMFSELPSPSYHQTSFQSFETGMVPMRPQ